MLDSPDDAARKALGSPGLSTVRTLTFAMDDSEAEIELVTIPVRKVLNSRIAGDDLAMVWKFLAHLEEYLHTRPTELDSKLRTALALIESQRAPTRDELREYCIWRVRRALEHPWVDPWKEQKDAFDDTHKDFKGFVPSKAFDRAQLLIDDLVRIDPAFATLKRDKVDALLRRSSAKSRGYVKGAKAVLETLICECGAFGSTDKKRVKEANKAAIRRRKRKTGDQP